MIALATIEQNLKHIAQVLAHLDEPMREAQALLSAATDLSTSYFYTWPEKPLSNDQQQLVDSYLQQRKTGQPLAYICGYKDFWSLRLSVKPGVLVPRPETELLVEKCLALSKDKPSGRLLDLGTGSGAIALAFASERPSWQVVAVDASETALAVTRENVKQLGLKNVEVIKSHWFDQVQGQFDIIASNPPYIDRQEPELTGDGVKFEPKEALVAEDQGLADIKHIAAEAPQFLVPDLGYLLVEHGYQQGEVVKAIFERAGFVGVDVVKDYAGLDRFTVGRIYS